MQFVVGDGALFHPVRIRAPSTPLRTCHMSSVRHPIKPAWLVVGAGNAVGAAAAGTAQGRRCPPGVDRDRAEEQDTEVSTPLGPLVPPRPRDRRVRAPMRVFPCMVTVSGSWPVRSSPQSSVGPTASSRRSPYIPSMPPVPYRRPDETALPDPGRKLAQPARGNLLQNRVRARQVWLYRHARLAAKRRTVEPACAAAPAPSAGLLAGNLPE